MHVGTAPDISLSGGACEAESCYWLSRNAIALPENEGGWSLLKQEGVTLMMLVQSFKSSSIRLKG